MAILDHFETRENTGFTRSIDPRTARRQLHMSFGVVALVAVATCVVALSANLGQRPGEPQGATHLVVHAPQVIHERHAGQAPSLLSGG